jgi:hypothetical protein
MQMENTRDWDLISVLANCVYVFDCRSALVRFYYVKGYKLQLCLYFLMWLFHSHIALTLHNNVIKIVSVNEISYIICSFIYHQLKFWQYPISRLKWQHQLCGNPKQDPDIKSLLSDHTCSLSWRGPRTPTVDWLAAAESTNHPSYATEEAQLVNGNLSMFSASSLSGPSDQGISWYWRYNVVA